MTNEKVSRRAVLGGGAVALAGLGAGLTTTAVPRVARADNAADAAALNEVLRLTFETTQVYDAAIGFLTDPSNPTGAVGAAIITHFRTQHRDAAARLTQQITALGGTPLGADAVPAPNAPVGFTRSVANYLKYAANLERAAAVANAGHNDSITDAGTAALVSALVGTQSQRFAVLNLLVRGIVVAGPMAAPNIDDIVPRSFVNLAAAPASSLVSVADLPFGAS